MADTIRRGIRTAQLGLLVNAVLAVVKLVAGILGNAYALVADAIESTADVFASLVVWGGLHVAGRDPDENYPFGYGKAEVLAAVVVSLFLVGAAVGIALEALREIRTPHEVPAAWTLFVLVAVMVIKAVLSRRTRAVGSDIGSVAVQADAFHHLSDAITSAAAFVGIALAVIGSRYTGDRDWAAADDWAALVAAAVIGFNGVRMLRPALHDLMDRSPGSDVVERIRAAAASPADVREVEKLNVRKAGMIYFVDIHVQAEPAMTLYDAHELAGTVKAAIRAAVPQVRGVLVHMEPYQEGRGRGMRAR
jgi:cation diffusion facilitator family transporter